MRQPRGLVGRQLLLVEDEARLREMLLQGTREMGFHPAAVATAEQALRALEQNPMPVMVVDLNLPGMGGMELLQLVRERWPHTQFIILTGFGDLQAARKAIHLDVVDFLTKPCALGDLEVALSRAFHRLQQVHPAALDPKFADLHHDRQDSDEEEEPPTTKPPAKPAFKPRDGSGSLSMEDIERQTILAALEKHNGNRADTAAELGISLRKLYYRLGEYQKRGLIN